MNVNSSSVGSYIKTVVGVAAAASAAGARNGAAIDRDGYDSCVLFAQAGAATGAPTTRTLDAKIQESEDGTTGWTDVEGAAIAQIAADNGSAKVNVDLSGVQRYIRVVQTVGFTGGTSPALPNSAAVVLGGPDELPAA